MRHRKGFTLIELLIVAVIIGLLQTVVILKYLGAQKQSRDAQRKSDLNKISSAIELWYANKKEYPPTDGWISSTDNNSSSETLAKTLLKEGYLDSIPCDPKVSTWNCSHGGHNNDSDPDFGYVYVVKNYNFSGSYYGNYPGKNHYAVYSTLEAPSENDLVALKNFTDYDKAYREYMLNQWHIDIKYKVGN